MTRQIRKTEMHRRRKRGEKLRELRKRYLKAETEEDKKKILEKVFKITPWISKEGFLAATPKK